MDPVMTHPTEGEIWKMCETDAGSINLSCLLIHQPPANRSVGVERQGHEHTGTFFWESTTAQSFPLTPTDMMFAAVMALKAYSVQDTRKLSLRVRHACDAWPWACPRLRRRAALARPHVSRDYDAPT